MRPACPDTEQPVLALAGRYPLLLHDLNTWVQAHPESTHWQCPADGERLLRQGPRRLLCNCNDPQRVLARLAEEVGTQALHLFPQVAGFLHFLAQPGAIDCIAHPDWVPVLLLPLQNALHFQQWLQQVAPRDWPWALLQANQFADAACAQAAGSLGMQLRDYVRQLSDRLARQIHARYVDRPTPAQILRAGQRPIRILVWAFHGSAYQQFCARDIAAALQSVGAEARCVLGVPGPAEQYELLQAVDSFDPDVLLLNGRDRSQCPQLPEQLCVLSWDQDHVLCSSSHYAKHRGRRDLLMVMVRDWREDALANGLEAERVAYVNLGTNLQLYHPGTPCEPEYDVLFVGNVYSFETYRGIIGFDRLDQTTQNLFLLARDRLGEWVRSRAETEPFIIPDIDWLLRDCLRQMGLGHSGDTSHWRFLVRYFRYRIAHLLLREAYICALAEFRLGLFGRGWDTIPQIAHLAQPEVENGVPLRELIHRSAITLHMHTWTVHHPRLYDTAAAGGFLLVGRVPEEVSLERVFEPGRELDSFGSIPELKRKIRHYLEHPEKRQAMAQAASRRAHGEHSMEHRAREMLSFLSRDVYAD